MAYEIHCVGKRSSIAMRDTLQSAEAFVRKKAKDGFEVWTDHPLNGDIINGHKLIILRKVEEKE